MPSNVILKAHRAHPDFVGFDPSDNGEAIDGPLPFNCYAIAYWRMRSIVSNLCGGCNAAPCARYRSSRLATTPLPPLSSRQSEATRDLPVRRTGLSLQARNSFRLEWHNEKVAEWTPAKPSFCSSARMDPSRCSCQDRLPDRPPEVGGKYLPGRSRSGPTDSGRVSAHPRSVYGGRRKSWEAFVTPEKRGNCSGRSPHKSSGR
jgi:hypothetical protein